MKMTNLMKCGFVTALLVLVLPSNVNAIRSACDAGEARDDCVAGNIGATLSVDYKVKKTCVPVPSPVGMHSALLCSYERDPGADPIPAVFSLNLPLVLGQYAEAASCDGIPNVVDFYCALAAASAHVDQWSNCSSTPYPPAQTTCGYGKTWIGGRGGTHSGFATGEGTVTSASVGSSGTGSCGFGAGTTCWDPAGDGNIILTYGQVLTSQAIAHAAPVGACVGCRTTTVEHATATWTAQAKNGASCHAPAPSCPYSTWHWPSAVA